MCVRCEKGGKVIEVRISIFERRLIDAYDANDVGFEFGVCGVLKWYGNCGEEEVGKVSVYVVWIFGVYFDVCEDER